MMKLKLCECGCGQPTRIATKTQTSQGKVKGQPTRFICGHHSRPVVRQGYIKDGIGYIPLTQGKWALVDAHNFHWLSQWNWHADLNRNRWYAKRGAYLSD